MEFIIRKTSFKFLILFRVNPNSLRYNADLKIPLRISTIKKEKRKYIKPDSANLIDIIVNIMVLAPISMFNLRKRGEYTVIINPFKNPARPIRNIGIAKK